jgi:DNA-binding GntR family transcriptional regulator
MATRGEIFQQSLREQHENGALKTGEPVPPVRQLSQEFRLSNTVVASVLGELVEEHLFHTVPDAGTFVGPPRRQGSARFDGVRRAGERQSGSAATRHQNQL